MRASALSGSSAPSCHLGSLEYVMNDLRRSDTARIVIMAKKPAAGAVKTRLSGVLPHDGSRLLYEAFLADKVEQVLSVPGARCVVSVAPPDPPHAMKPWLAAAALPVDAIELVAQQGAHLGERLTALASWHFSRDSGPLLLVDSDTPTLPPAFFDEALRALRSGQHDIVLGPAADGGYYLIGLAQPFPPLFEDVAWSTAQVLAQTLACARRLSLRVHLLQSWRDIDRPADVTHLVEDLAELPPSASGFPRRTAAVLARLLPSPRLEPRNEHWTTLSSRPVYETRWLRVSENVVLLPAGGVALYGVVRTGPCVGVLPFVAPDRVVLVRQFRYVARRFTWEIPTGGVQAGESLEEAARRELMEESGFTARTLRPLVAFTPSKSILDETAHLFVAHDLEAAALPPDETEEMSVELFSFADAVRMAESGEILDSMSIIALLLARHGRD